MQVSGQIAKLPNCTAQVPKVKASSVPQLQLMIQRYSRIDTPNCNAPPPIN